MKWTKIFSHSVYDSTFLFTSHAEALSNSAPSGKYSILNQVKNMRQEDGKFHFKLCYGGQVTGSDKCNEWKQKTNPVTSSSVENYEPINNFYNDGFNGLCKSSEGDKTFLSSCVQGEWWFAVGAMVAKSGTRRIPGPKDLTQTSLQLFIKKPMQNVLNNPNKKCGVLMSQPNISGTFQHVFPWEYAHFLFEGS